MSLPWQQSKNAIQLTERGISTLSLLYNGTGTGIFTWICGCAIREILSAGLVAFPLLFQDLH